ncbi:MAG TPA: hypothetical protein DCP36_04785 [Sporomusaceae bacterium]|nr:hypothetical protein [Sporomusaceae bacterium]
MGEYFPSIVGAITYLIVVVLLGFIGFWGSGFVIKYFETLGPKLAEIIVSRIKTPCLILIIEMIFILTTTLSIFFYQREINLFEQSLFLPLLLFVIMFEGIVMNSLKNKYTTNLSIFNWIKTKAENYPYFKERIILLFNQTLGILIILTLFWFIANIMFKFHWPKPFYYIVFLALPVLLTLWTYLSFFPIDVQTKETIDARRFLVYIVLACVSIYDNYSKFEIYILKVPHPEDGSVNLFLITISVVFIAFDRMFKLWSDDIIKYREEKKKSTQTENIL